MVKTSMRESRFSKVLFYVEFISVVALVASVAYLYVYTFSQVQGMKRAVEMVDLRVELVITDSQLQNIRRQIWQLHDRLGKNPDDIFSIKILRESESREHDLSRKLDILVKKLRE